MDNEGNIKENLNVHIEENETSHSTFMDKEDPDKFIELFFQNLNLNKSVEKVGASVNIIDKLIIKPNPSIKKISTKNEKCSII